VIHALPVRRDSFEARIEAVARAAERAARLADGEQPPAMPSVPTDPDGSPARVLAEALGLSADELDLVWSIVARAIDPRVAAHVRAVHGDRHGLSIGQHAAMWGLAPSTTRKLLAIADPRHLLRELGIVIAVTPHADVDTCWTAAPRLWSFLAGTPDLDAAIAAHGGVHAVPPDPLLDPVQAATLGRLESWLAADDLTMI
jgi:hypothetical protein